LIQTLRMRTDPKCENNAPVAETSNFCSRKSGARTCR
jgi:hypothetical protein